MWRRASLQLKTLVNRRTSIATDTVGDHGDHDFDGHGPWHDTTTTSQRRQGRSNHAPSRSHHIFTTQNILTSNSPPASAMTTSPLRSSPSPATSPLSGRSQHQSTRPSSSHNAPARGWKYLRKATSTHFRHSRILHGDFAAQPSSSHISTDELPHTVPRPGLGNEPPVIPRNTGSGARAAVAAWQWQHDMFPSTFKNKLRNLDLAQKDRESGIGLAVTSDSLEDMSLAVANGSEVMGSAPSKVDFVDRLPLELAIQVLAHLDAAGLASASRVSKVWHEVSSLQDIWKESYLRERSATYATSEPIRSGAGLGVPAVEPGMDWKKAYAATDELSKRWRQGKATSVWLNGHSDSIYCLQFDE